MREKQSPEILLLLFFLTFMLPAARGADGAEFKIGVLANRGAEECRARWQPTADALTERLRHSSFSIEPLDFNAVDAAVQENRVDFIIVNSGIYVRLEMLYGAERIATLENLVFGTGETLFGSAIFTRADRTDITALDDLNGKSVMAVDAESFGGWLAAWRELKGAGIDPFRDLQQMLFGGIHDAPVYAVRERKVDAGIVRTDTLEHMAAEGKINPDDFRVLPAPRDAAHPPGDFRFLHSTRLYPEWPIAKLRHTPREISDEVCLALLTIRQNDPAAVAGGYAGWTTPLNYQPVHECLKELRQGPYKDFGRITLADVLKAYGHWILIVLIIMLTMGWLLRNVILLNRTLKKALAEVKNLSGLIPICASCKRIRDDQGYWEQIEIYIREHSDAEFTHGICPECMKKLYPELYADKDSEPLKKGTG